MEHKNIQFREQICVANAKYLVSLSHEQLKEKIRRGDEGEWNGENLFNDLDVYARTVKKWLKQSIIDMRNKGYIETEYKYSDKMINKGRIYVKGFGVQKLTRELRGFLIKHTVDIDMRNSMPSLILGMMKKYYPEKSQIYFTLNKYVTNREDFLKRNNVEKMDILKIMNKTHTKKVYENNEIGRFNWEMKQIQELFFNDIENKIELDDSSKIYKNGLKQNKYGKFLNHIYVIMENEILQRAIEIAGRENVETPMFDGFTVNAEKLKKNLLEELNKMTSEYEIKWTQKEHCDKIKLEPIEVEFKESLSYEELKEKLEEEIFMIENPILYGKTYKINGESKTQFYPYSSFRELLKPYKYFDNGEKEFLPKWLEDTNRRSYKEINFIPTDDVHQDIYNTFEGFNYSRTSSIEKTHIDTFINHIEYLTDYDEESKNYMIKYLAHLVQHPEINPQVAIILKSKQGWGKDTLIDIVEKMLGRKSIIRTSNMDDIFGNYNTDLRNKLVCVFNEVEGKEGYEKKEKLKNLITEKRTVMREKYISNYEQTNYSRIFIMSNNMNPVEINFDDRRFVVFQAHHKKKSSSYFSELHSLIEKDEFIQSIYNYLMTLDILNFSPRHERPKTKAYENMKQNNENPIYKFLWETFVKDGWENMDKEICKRQKKNPHIFFIQSQHFMIEYKAYLTTHQLYHLRDSMNVKLFRSLLGELGIVKKQKKIGGKNNDYYCIDKNELEDLLCDHQFEEDIEEFSEDDFF